MVNVTALTPRMAALTPGKNEETERQARYYQGIYETVIVGGKAERFSVIPLADGSGWSILGNHRGSVPTRILKDGSVVHKPFMCHEYQQVLPAGSLKIQGTSAS